MEFTGFPKIARLNREVVVTEKIDGTNGCIYVGVAGELCGGLFDEKTTAVVGTTRVLAGSRSRWITPGDDNYGFAAWVKENAEELAFKLGPGLHYGEWWGRGIQRGYGLAERRFSLFNTNRWDDAAARPSCCRVVPTLWRGSGPEMGFDADGLKFAERLLRYHGSQAAPGFMDPEGYIAYHTAANLCFKVTLKGDEAGKSQEAHEKKKRAPKQPRDPATGGRRKAQVPIDFADRRRSK